MMPENSHFIDGQWHEGEGDSIAVENPTTAEEITTVNNATEGEIEEALTAARSAQVAWGRRPPVERGALLRETASVIAENVEELSDLLIEEQGKTRSVAEFEVSATAEYVRYMADWDRRIEGEILPSDDQGESIHLVRKPYGVVGAIIPWNFPLFVLFRKLAPALVAGNTVIAKPSEETPLSTLRMWELVEEEVDFPDGVVNFLTGDGSVGEGITSSDVLDLISFTGHRDTGIAIAREAAKDLTETQLELGGKAPAIVWKDADIEKAVERILKANTSFAGQLCTSVERIYVHSDVQEEFERTYTDAAEDLSVGDPAEDPDMGPHVNEAELEKTRDAVERAREEGAKILTGGGPPADRTKGYWYEPTVVTDIDQDSVLMDEEIFGPVSPIVSVSSFDEVIEYSNETEYGLSAYVYTDSYSTAMRGAHEIEFGEVYVNRTLGEALQGFHTGWNQSGNSGEDGKHGALKYTRLKTVYHNYGDGEPGW